MDVVVGILCLFFAALVFIVYAKWATEDARRRNKPPLLVLAAVVLFFPFGLIAWILFRPDISPVRRLEGPGAYNRPRRVRSLL